MSMFSLRIPEDQREWLERNIPSGEMTEFIVESIRRRIASERQVGSIEAHEPLSPMEERLVKEYVEMKRRDRKRSFDETMNPEYNYETRNPEYKEPFIFASALFSPEAPPTSVEQLKLFANWIDERKTIELEKTERKERQAGYKFIDTGQWAKDAEYMRDLLSEPEEGRARDFMRIVEKANELWLSLYPEKYKNKLSPEWTLGKYVCERFEKLRRKEFTIPEIAAELGLTYAQAHNRVRSLLEREGYTCVRSQLPKQGD